MDVAHDSSVSCIAHALVSRALAVFPALSLLTQRRRTVGTVETRLAETVPVHALATVLASRVAGWARAHTQRHTHTHTQRRNEERKEKRIEER